MEKPQNQLNQLDTAILLEKLIVVNGMLQYGTKEEKTFAKKEIVQLQRQVLQAINPAVIEQAKYEMNITDEDLSFSNSVPLFRL